MCVIKCDFVILTNVRIQIYNIQHLPYESFDWILTFVRMTNER